MPHNTPGPDEPIIDTIGRLATLAYRLNSCRRGKQRESILRDLQAASNRLDGLLVETCGNDDTGDRGMSGQVADGGTARAVAIRFMSTAGGFVAGQWHDDLFSPVAADAYADGMAGFGVKVRCYDVAVDLDNGAARIAPRPRPAVVAPCEGMEGQR